MPDSLARRRFLKTVVAAAAVAVVAFDPTTKAWASHHGPGKVKIPKLDGELLFDAATRTQAADDFGHIISKTPSAVLVPGSVDDIVAIVKFARKFGFAVAGSRGLGESHSTYGQAQLDVGVVIDMRALAEIHEISTHSVLVDAGVRWSEILAVTVPLGKSPPTLTDYIELSVGGTLSMGGIGGQVSRHGLQVDNVLELEVVTGEGKRVKCSPTKRAALFHAVRSGLGQFGIIVRARIRLVDVAPMARVYTATYTDAAVFAADQMALADDQRFDYLEGMAELQPAGAPIYKLEATKYFTPGTPPDDSAMLAGLSFVPGTVVTNDVTYFDFANRIAATVAFLQSVGAWALPHPWIDVFVPGPDAAAFVESRLAEEDASTMGGGPILFYAFRRDKVTTPFLALPDTEHVFLFSLLRFAPPEAVAGLVAQNRAVYDELVPLGGKRYPIGSLDVTQADWQDHFGDAWADFVAAKEEYDPDYVLTPGHGIF
ncbi:FAD-binding protein [Polyangium sorediatum]|uniref:FAD-binding protein n=1 Tax=Polyangium sorediatum TaxID=889274 RepID=A0ABT6P7V3_9BACT|nr:FAD-binding protein [Polyangium sorediatum]MDI1436658.1 FAD-binding protein [Polyangium sorediatum]